MLALRIMQGIAKTLAEHVLDLKHSPLSKQAMKRQTLRLWAEYSLGTSQSHQLFFGYEAGRLRRMQRIDKQ